MTNPPAPEPRRSVRRGLLIAGVALLATCLAAWAFAPTLLALPSTTVRWQLASGFGPALDRDSSVVAVYLDQWPAESCLRGGGWLATPIVIETPWSVTITMHTASSFAGCGGWYDFWGEPVDVPLAAPLGGRMLFDGSTIPPAPRS